MDSNPGITSTTTKAMSKNTRRLRRPTKTDYENSATISQNHRCRGQYSSCSWSSWLASMSWGSCRSSTTTASIIYHNTRQRPSCAWWCPRTTMSKMAGTGGYSTVSCSRTMTQPSTMWCSWTTTPMIALTTSHENMQSKPGKHSGTRLAGTYRRSGLTISGTLKGNIRPIIYTRPSPATAINTRWLCSSMAMTKS